VRNNLFQMPGSCEESHESGLWGDILAFYGSGEIDLEEWL
jgi:hypothetical protein